jgi:hypothetical protein
MQMQDQLPIEYDSPMILSLNDQSHACQLYFHKDETLKTAPKWQSLANKSIWFDGVIVPSGDMGYNHP